MDYFERNKILQNWKVAFVKINGRYPTRADWIRRSPALIRDVYASTLETRDSKKLEKEKIIGRTKLEKCKLRLDSESIKLEDKQRIILSKPSGRKSINNYAELQQKGTEIESQQIVLPSCSSLQQPFMSPQKIVDSFCGLKPVLRSSPRKLPSSLFTTFESPQKSVVLSLASRSINPSKLQSLTNLLVDPNDESGPSSLKDDEFSVNVEPSPMTIPFEDLIIGKNKPKRMMRRKSGNFVKLNLKRKIFLRAKSGMASRRKR